MDYLLHYIGTSYNSIKQDHPQEYNDVLEVVNSIKWEAVKVFEDKYKHQRAYNKLFDIEFEKRGWIIAPVVSNQCGQKADHGKNRVHTEVEFGPTSKIYHCYYKFQISQESDINDLGVLILPIKAKEFFPERKSPTSVSNMVEYNTAIRFLSLLKNPVPLMIVGVKP